MPVVPWEVEFLKPDIWPFCRVRAHVAKSMVVPVLFYPSAPPWAAGYHESSSTGSILGTRQTAGSVLLPTDLCLIQSCPSCCQGWLALSKFEFLLVDWQKTQLHKSHFLMKPGWKCSNTASISRNPYFSYFIFPQLVMFSAQDLIWDREHWRKFSTMYDSKLTCAFVIPGRSRMYKYFPESTVWIVSHLRQDCHLLNVCTMTCLRSPRLL